MNMTSLVPSPDDNSGLEASNTGTTPSHLTAVPTHEQGVDQHAGPASAGGRTEPGIGQEQNSSVTRGGARSSSPAQQENKDPGANITPQQPGAMTTSPSEMSGAPASKLNQLDTPQQQHQADSDDSNNPSDRSFRPIEEVCAVQSYPQRIESQVTLLGAGEVDSGGKTPVRAQKSNLSSPMNRSPNKFPKNVSFQSRVSVVQVESVKQQQSDRRRPDPDADGCCGPSGGLMHTPPRNVPDNQGRVVRLNLIHVARGNMLFGVHAGLRELDIMHVPKPLRQKGLKAETWREMTLNLTKLQQKHMIPWMRLPSNKDKLRDCAKKWDAEMRMWFQSCNDVLKPIGVYLQPASHCEPHQNRRGRVERWFSFALTADERDSLMEEPTMFGYIRPEEADFIMHPPYTWY
ncbi:unnamed protein product [Amoebophrya sp. A120]|nr:unnamed protein product [Amoebophrya sp. A120]|eukprot:GSA120T00017632001.1